jgi:DNA-directed RNA polymerase specialized sigma54-like protein
MRLDVDLVAKLAESGYAIARRTVTKYREVQNIQSSRKRRVWDTTDSCPRG